MNCAYHSPFNAAQRCAPRKRASPLGRSGGLRRIADQSGSRIVPLPGKARDIGIGPEGSVFVVGNDGTVHKWNGSTWIKRDGILNEISVGAGGVPVGVNASKQIWMGYP
ncbi:MAG: hypothetical protein Q8M11_22045 [Sulfuritalea sp.]|nr:hypothetical protein [Sulfuritalea sp.]MDP1981621.1 hypothetical protein [Sulfuritalea sp.]